MSYYQFNKQEIQQKAKERHSKEKAAEYCSKNKEAIKEKFKKKKKKTTKDRKTCLQKRKTRLKSIKEKDISNCFSTKKKHQKINEFCFQSV